MKQTAYLSGTPPPEQAGIEANSYPVRQRIRELTIMAWVVTVLISILPEAVWGELIGNSPPWLAFVKMALLFVLALAAVLWNPLRPLCNYFIAMLTFFGCRSLTEPGLAHRFLESNS